MCRLLLHDFRKASTDWLECLTSFGMSFDALLEAGWSTACGPAVGMPASEAPETTAVGPCAHP